MISRGDLFALKVQKRCPRLSLQANARHHTLKLELTSASGDHMPDFMLTLDMN